MRHFLILLLCCGLVTAAELPQSVYDQWADPSVAVINMPAGSYRLRADPGGVGIQALVLRRSNVTVNFAGCTLLVNPSDTYAAFPVQATSQSVVSPTWPPSPNTGPPNRYISHLTGAITTGTTQLTMASNEIVPVQPGETVLIWAGVTPTDPHEAAGFIPATVAAVNCNTGLITFTAPLGKNIVNYVNAAGLMAVSESSQHSKIGDWGTYPLPSNFSKGYGTDHGMERFTGGMIGNVTFNNLTMNLDLVTTLANMPSTMWDVSAVAVNGFTLNNASILNPHKIGLHLWRSFNVAVNGYSLTGEGLGKIWNANKFEAVAVGIWGGEHFDFDNVSIAGSNIVFTITEVGVGDVSVDGLAYDVVFTDARDYAASTVFNWAALLDSATIRDVSLEVATASGPGPHIYFSYAPIIQEGYLRFPGASLTAIFDWGYQRSITLNGTVGLGGIEYGPKISVTNQITVVHGQAVQTLTVPEGVYTAARIKVVAAGDMRSIQDSYGNTYWATGGTSAFVDVNPGNWKSIPAGAPALAAYMTKQLKFWMNNAGSLADGTVTFEYTYLPRI